VTGLSLALRYTLFAALSTATNLGVQKLTGSIAAGPWSLYIKMAFGTAAGVVVKYLLDKRYIFHYTPPSRRAEAMKFLLYTSLSVVTTLVFWATELLFHRLFAFDGSEYLGAATGLTLGYTLKYRLDKHFVFTRPAGDRENPA